MTDNDLYNITPSEENTSDNTPVQDTAEVPVQDTTQTAFAQDETENCGQDAGQTAFAQTATETVATENCGQDAAQADMRYDKYIRPEMQGTPVYGQPMYGQGGYPAQTPGSFNFVPQGYAPYYAPTDMAAQGFDPMNGIQGQLLDNGKPKKEKTHKVRKVVFGLLMGLLAGVLAGVGFVGSNFLFQKLFPEAEKDYGIQNVITGENSTSDIADAVMISDAVSETNTSTTDVSQIVSEVAPAIVQINCTFSTQNYLGTYTSSGAGSGIIIKKTDNELLIATNNHVVDQATSIKITFNDDTTAEATIKGSDSTADLAVVSVELDKLEKAQLDNIVVAKLGSSDDVRVGQMAIAIGNAMGYGQSTTVGYISAKDREITVDGVKMVLLQTDAAINPGNSGGALINVSGEVIGINSVKFAANSVEGMGFAIPISRAQKILDELGNREILKEEEQGYLSVSVQTVTESVAEAYNWPIGAYFAEVDEGGAADKAGIQVGDIATAVNGITVKTVTDFKACIHSYRVGTTVTVTVQRLENGIFVEKDIEVVLQTNPDLLKKQEEEKAEGTTTDQEGASEAEDGQIEDKEDEKQEEAPVIVDPRDGMPNPSNGNNQGGNQGGQQNPSQGGNQGGQQNPGDYYYYIDPFSEFGDIFGFDLW